MTLIIRRHHLAPVPVYPTQQLRMTPPPHPRQVPRGSFGWKKKLPDWGPREGDPGEGQQGLSALQEGWRPGLEEEHEERNGGKGTPGGGTVSPDVSPLGSAGGGGASTAPAT